MRVVIILILFLVPYDSFSQDTSLTLNNLKFNLKYVDRVEKDTLKIHDLKTLTITDNSIITESSTIDLDNLESISFRVGNQSFVKGATHGAIAGTIIGLFGTAVLGNKVDWGREGGGVLLIPLFICGSAIIGAITGGIISITNGRYIDYKLSRTTPDYKRKELKRLMEKWGKR